MESVKKAECTWINSTCNATCFAVACCVFVNIWIKLICCVLRSRYFHFATEVRSVTFDWSQGMKWREKKIKYLSCFFFREILRSEIRFFEIVVVNLLTSDKNLQHFSKGNFGCECMKGNIEGSLRQEVILSHIIMTIIPL